MVDRRRPDPRLSIGIRLQLGFVALVGLSAGLVSLQGDPSPVVFVGAVLGGLVVGAALVWWLVPRDGDSGESDRSRRP